MNEEAKRFKAETCRFLSDPFLQLPTSHAVHVVWFTSFEGVWHWVEWGKEGEEQRIWAQSRRLSRMREDSKDSEEPMTGCSTMSVWRHEAVITDLLEGQRYPYRVFSQITEDAFLCSPHFTLAAAPGPDQPLKILLTSDHQRKPMVPANLQKALETMGHFDAVFFAGDLVEIADGYLDWFLDARGFFPCLQGTAKALLGDRTYRGGEIIQHTPLFPAIGNHDVMGRYSLKRRLFDQFQDPYPRHQASSLYPHANERELKDNSFNTDSYEEIFTLPTQQSGQATYYAHTIGDIRLIVLYATRTWRSPLQESHQRGKYQESKEHLDCFEQWGGGDFIFEPLHKGSQQYEWLVQELQSEPFQQAELRLVMLHNPLHTLGENAVPAFTDPVQTISRDEAGRIIAIDYEYPKAQDILIRDIEPLLEAYGVDIVFYGHSHLWNRFQSSQGMHFLESSNVGNSYGAYTHQNKQRRDSIKKGPSTDYQVVEDPNGLHPITPTLAPLKDEEGRSLPYIASNDITVFSVLDTGQRVIDSYYFDLRHPELGVVKFDSFCPYRRRSAAEEIAHTNLFKTLQNSASSLPR